MVLHVCPVVCEHGAFEVFSWNLDASRWWWKLIIGVSLEEDERGHLRVFVVDSDVHDPILPFQVVNRRPKVVIRHRLERHELRSVLPHIAFVPKRMRVPVLLDTLLLLLSPHVEDDLLGLLHITPGMDLLACLLEVVWNDENVVV